MAGIKTAVVDSHEQLVISCHEYMKRVGDQLRTELLFDVHFALTRSH